MAANWALSSPMNWPAISDRRHLAAAQRTTSSWIRRLTSVPGSCESKRKKTETKKIFALKNKNNKEWKHLNEKFAKLIEFIQLIGLQKLLFHLEMKSPLINDFFVQLSLLYSTLRFFVLFFFADWWKLLANFCRTFFLIVSWFAKKKQERVEANVCLFFHLFFLTRIHYLIANLRIYMPLPRPWTTAGFCGFHCLKVQDYFFLCDPFTAQDCTPHHPLLHPCGKEKKWKFANYWIFFPLNL